MLAAIPPYWRRILIRRESQHLAVGEQDSDSEVGVDEGDPAVALALLQEVAVGGDPGDPDQDVLAEERMRIAFHADEIGKRAAILQPMNERDIELRNATYARFVKLGRAPTLEETGEAASTRLRRSRRVGIGCTRRTRSSSTSPRDPHGEPLLGGPDPVSGPRRAARVVRELRLGCVRHLRRARSPTGASRRRVRTAASRSTSRSATTAPTTTDLLFHCLVPAAHWWDDIVFT